MKPLATPNRPHLQTVDVVADELTVRFVGSAAFTERASWGAPRRSAEPAGIAEGVVGEGRQTLGERVEERPERPGNGHPTH